MGGKLWAGIQDTTIKVYVRVRTGSDMSFINTTVDIGLGDSIKDLREISQNNINMSIKPGSFQRFRGRDLQNEDRTLFSYELTNYSRVECQAEDCCSNFVLQEHDL